MSTISKSRAGKVTFEHEGGDTFIRTITLRIQDSDPVEYVNLTGAALHFKVFTKHNGDELIALTIGDGITVDNAAEGTATIVMDTSELVEGKTYWCEYYAVFTGDIIQTFLEGNFKNA